MGHSGGGGCCCGGMFGAPPALGVAKYGGHNSGGRCDRAVFVGGFVIEAAVDVLVNSTSHEEKRRTSEGVDVLCAFVVCNALGRSRIRVWEGPFYHFVLFYFCMGYEDCSRASAAARRFLSGCSTNSKFL